MVSQKVGGDRPVAQAPPSQKIVGPNISGAREEYRLERRLQSGLFGGVYEAKGLTSGREFAVKVLHRSELHKAQRASSLEFCEVPLSEVRFADLMRGQDHVMQVEENFEDQYCHYIVFELARGGDLLEALKLRPRGFEEHEAQFLIGQAARGLAGLHERRLAMQDVSLENMLLNVLIDGLYQVKVCDPGQAVVFEVDPERGEVPVEFHGFVGKSFRPPELHQKQPYLATKVDSWCMGWSTFYLLAAQPLFLSADPAQQDPDWDLFERAEIATLFRQKGTSCSQQCIDFILRLLLIDPKERMSVAEALQHEWLRDAHNVRPMYAPKEVLPPGPYTPDHKTIDRHEESRRHGGGGREEQLHGRYPSPGEGVELAARPPKAGVGSPGGGGGGGGAQASAHGAPNAAAGGVYSGLTPTSLVGRGGSSNGLASLGGASAGGGGAGPQQGSGGGAHGDWQGRHRGNSQHHGSVAPAWTAAPPSRSESPGPGRSPVGIRTAHYQGLSSTGGTPAPNQYASVQVRAASPFGVAQRGYAPLQQQQRSPSPPPRPGAAVAPNPRVGNVYGGRDAAAAHREAGRAPGRDSSAAGGWGAGGGADAQRAVVPSQASMHTPRPAALSVGSERGAAAVAAAIAGFGHPGGGLPDLGAGGGAEEVGDFAYNPAAPSAGSPAGSEGHLSGHPGVVTGTPTMKAKAVATRSNREPSQADNRFGMSQEGAFAGHGSGARQNSPMPQPSLVVRTPNVRGVSPSPMRSVAAGLDPAAAAYAQRAGSPHLVQPQHHRSSSPAAVAAAAAAAAAGAQAPAGGHLAAAARSISGANANVVQLDGSPTGSASQGYWSSPRAAYGAGAGGAVTDAYPRGRSHSRTLSPGQVVNTYSSQSPTPVIRTGSPGLVTLEPSRVVPSRTSIAWSPVPPSPPAPKRSLSPSPASVMTNHAASSNSAPSLRWIG